MSDVLIRDRRALPRQVYDLILDLIGSNGLSPGEQLPPEPALAERFAVGRSTVREALKLLEQDGLIEVRHGLGRFVSAIAQLRAARPITRFESATEMMSRLGYDFATEVLDVAERGPTPTERKLLDLSAGSRVVCLKRLRTHSGEPFVYLIDAIDRRVLSRSPDEYDWSGSVVSLLEGEGHRVVSSAAQVRATTLPREAARKLRQRGAHPWLLITETCVTDAGRAVLHANDYHRGDMFGFHFVRRR
jgi:GntR family transcriptional regulator